MVPASGLHVCEHTHKSGCGTQQSKVTGGVRGWLEAELGGLGIEEPDLVLTKLNYMRPCLKKTKKVNC